MVRIILDRGENVMPELSQADILRIAICDDDPHMLTQLQDLTQTTLTDRWQLDIACYSEYHQMLADAGGFHIVLLDIQLADGNGIDLARKIAEVNPECHILFVSGYVCYVSDVYDVPHLCLVLKDQLQLQLPRFLRRAAEETVRRKDSVLTVKVNGESIRLNIAQIRFLEQRGHITYINLVNAQQLQVREKLAELSQTPELLRCHVSYAVNLRWVECMLDRDFLMHGGERVPISRANAKNAKAAFYRYLVDHT